MAVTAGSITQGVTRNPQGAYPDPFVIPVLLTGGVSFKGGVLLIAGTGNEVTKAAEDPVETTIIGVLTPQGPRRQDNVPLTSTTAPAASLPRQRTTPAGTPNPANLDSADYGASAYLFLPGATFRSHFVGTNSNGTDVRGDNSINMQDTAGYSLTILTGGANAEVNYSEADLWFIAPEADTNITQSDGAVRLINFVPTQPTSAPGGTFSQYPGQFQSGASGTFNPLCVWAPLDGLYF